jgi:outer membrane protein assembly factor BamB
LLLVVAACGTPIAGESWAGLSTDGHYVYVAYSEQVFRVDPQAPNDPVNSNSKHIEWLSQAPGKTHMYPPPALSDSALYSGAFDGKLYAFNLKGGALSGWVPPATGSGKLLGAATLDKNILYQGMGNDGIRAYNPVTGQEIASYKGTKYGVWSAPIVVNDTVYFTSLDHYLYALTSGTLLYKWQVDLGGTAADSPVFDKSTGMLYAGTYSDEVVAVDTNQNPPRVVHRFATSNWVWGSPVLDQGTLYFGDLNGTIYALDPKTFAVKWTAAHPDEVGGFRGRLAIVNDAHPIGTKEPMRLLLGGSENKRVYAFNADTGALVWTSALVMNDKILSNLLVLKPDVIFSTQDENQLIVALNTDSGQIDWQVSLKAEVPRFPPTPQSP